jgi:hypothetical protein
MSKRIISHPDTNHHTAEPEVVRSVLQVTPPAPTQKAPAVPSGFDLSEPVGRQGSGWPTLGGAAAPASSEARSSTTFQADFGTKVDPNEVADALASFAAWHEESERARAWQKYVAAGNAQSGKAARRQLELLGGAFQTALTADPTVATRYPQLAALYRARGSAGVRAAATRAAVKAAKATPAK